MIICLYGPTLSGKTTVARAVAADLAIGLRSCGDAVRAQALALGKQTDYLSDSTHSEIDRETIIWTKDQSVCLVEGRFLDAVLAGQEDVVALQIKAAEDVRADRGRSRFANYSIDDVRSSDAQDEVFRSRLYGCRTTIVPIAVIDTSERTASECVTCVKSIIKRL